MARMSLVYSAPPVDECLSASACAGVSPQNNVPEAGMGSGPVHLALGGYGPGGGGLSAPLTKLL